jgi:hypothetical protein
VAVTEGHVHGAFYGIHYRVIDPFSGALLHFSFLAGLFRGTDTRISRIHGVLPCAYRKEW